MRNSVRAGPVGRVVAEVAARWKEADRIPPEATVVVAVSGGLDSLVLLHLLRFPLGRPGVRVVGAHFDHAMRPTSGADADWVRGLARAWDTPVRIQRAEVPPRSEAEARELRYAFLWGVREEVGAAAVVTAHHLDDQVETILFRVARGSGIAGLGGMRIWRAPGLFRPLLGLGRSELEAYAAEVGLRARVDPTNLDPGPSRNRIRHEVLPLLESAHPGARQAILRLGRNARRTTEALDELLVPVIEHVVLDRADGRITLARAAVGALSRPVRNAVVRALAVEAGLRLDEAGTDRLEEFITEAPSGRRIQLPGGARLTSDFHRVHLDPSGRKAGEPLRDEAEWDEVLSVESPWPGGWATATIAGRRVEVQWGEDPGEGWSGDVARLDPGGVAFPLTVRRAKAGDRVRWREGSRKLKRVFRELRVPVEERGRTIVVIDGSGLVLWLPCRQDPIVDDRTESGHGWPFAVRITTETET
ncbi:MAG: tRNA lysidine(34) synthetase TilS [Gemmatimonadota bacterium]